MKSRDTPLHAADHIQTPRRWTMDHFGPIEEACRPGDYLRSPKGKLYLVLSERPVRVKVTRGETLRQALQVVPWPDDLPEDAHVIHFTFHKREKPRPKTLQELT